MSSATTSAPPTNTTPKSSAPKGFDPEEYRMSIGDHLEELRNRLFLGVAGFFVACVICFIFGEQVTRWFIKPFIVACDRRHISPQMYTVQVAESFMTYIKIVMVTAATMAGPWILYQIWQFIAAGLYPKERKYITKYLPLSITLLVSGMVFLYFYVLPLMLEFFLAFTLGPAMHFPHPLTATGPATAPVQISILNEDPKDPEPGALWIDAKTGLLKICPVKGTVRVLPFGSDELVSPLITMADYIDMVIGLLLSFGLSFQMPLVVLALNRVGIMSIEVLKKWRRVVYFSMSIIAACIVPDVATGMIALLIPLILLYELGILLAQWSEKKAKEAEAAES